MLDKSDVVNSDNVKQDWSRLENLLSKKKKKSC